MAESKTGAGNTPVEPGAFYSSTEQGCDKKKQANKQPTKNPH